MANIVKNAQITFNPKPKNYAAVTCLIDFPGISVDSGAYGGFETVSRPKNVGLVNWTGFEPLQMSVPILFDSLQSNNSVEADILNLEKLAGRGVGVGGSIEPPEVTLDTQDGFSALVPHYKSGDLVFVINGIDWGDNIRRGTQADGSGGHRVRAAAVVTVIQHVEAESLQEKSVAKRNNFHSRRRSTHVVKAGETLQKIARDQYGTSDLWTEIARANNIRDPLHLPTGKKLKIP